MISTRRWDDPTKASRPFSADRDGFVLGEGAWMFVLEDADHAAERGATALAEFAGYASTCDAYHRVRLAEDGDGFQDVPALFRIEPAHRRGSRNTLSQVPGPT